MRTFILMFAVFMDLILLTRFKMHIKTVLFCAGLELMAFFCFSEAGFYSLFFCFFIIGILKWIRKILKKRSDVANSHFLRPAGPHFPASQGHIKRSALEIGRARGAPPC